MVTRWNFADIVWNDMANSDMALAALHWMVLLHSICLPEVLGSQKPGHLHYWYEFIGS